MTTLLEAIKYFGEPNKYGVQPFQKEGEFGLRNREGKQTVLDNTFAEWKSKYPSRYFLCRRNHRWGLFSPQGKKLTLIKYDEIHEDAGPKYLIAEDQNDNIGVLDSVTGKTILPFVYRQFGKTTKPVGGWWFKNKKDVKEVFDKNFKSHADEVWVRKVNWFDPFIYVENHKGQNGVYNKSTNAMTIPFGLYSDISYIRDKNPKNFFDTWFELIDANGYTGIMSLTGKIVLPFKYDDVERLEKYNLFTMTDGDKQGVYNVKTQKWIIPLSKKNYINIDNLGAAGYFFNLQEAYGKERSGLMKYDPQVDEVKWIIPQIMDGGIDYHNGYFSCSFYTPEGQGGYDDEIEIKYSPTKGFDPKQNHSIIKNLPWQPEPEEE